MSLFSVFEFEIWFNFLYDAFLEGLTVCDLFSACVFLCSTCLFFLVHNVENRETTSYCSPKNIKLRTRRTNLKTKGTISKHVFECFLFSRIENGFQKQQLNKP